ncbi:uncharacterized protein K452DRAFT_111834 [Aplosporella prunicola CBS 121167]|uniref:Uncharacterized protein n=1 Tax=Aplosporella prunicola CBS 121167 TaxID=1176127 RepID=A0A6A6B253_9PEZI|nr:uncharacterized protein K452DRAFT_111834 [Aplosporella prunicola CBS 121167]KAF2137345.1 hypothetical protein K452DRAFT_111834 [Aplosporella prunicola CBS 121167]
MFAPRLADVSNSEGSREQLFMCAPLTLTADSTQNLDGISRVLCRFGCSLSAGRLSASSPEHAQLWSARTSTPLRTTVSELHCIQSTPTRGLEWYSARRSANGVFLVWRSRQASPAPQPPWRAAGPRAVSARRPTKHGEERHDDARSFLRARQTSIGIDRLRQTVRGTAGKGAGMVAWSGGRINLTRQRRDARRDWGNRTLSEICVYTKASIAAVSIRIAWARAFQSHESGATANLSGLFI